MADDMEFESFENLDDLDWSDLEKELQDKQEAEQESPPAEAPRAAGGEAEANAATVSGGKHNVDINYLLDVNLQVMVEVGRRQTYISELLGWDHGSVIELNKLVGEPLNLLVNNKPVAKGEVVVVNEKFALKITEILDPKARVTMLSS